VAEIGTDINIAAALLRSGECVAIPTETVYGLAANALNEEAVSSVFRIKNRPDFDPLIVHCGSLEAAMYWGSHWPAEAIKLAEKFWPGPLTLVVPRSKKLPLSISSGLDTVGIRVPNHELTLKLLKSLDFPLAAPSANPFGYVSPTTAMHVQNNLGGRIPYILDGGSCAVGVESAIVAFPEQGPILLRHGGIPKEEIEKCIGPVMEQLHSSSSPKAPGMLSCHYAPSVPVKVFEGSTGKPGEALLSLYGNSNSAGFDTIKTLSQGGDVFEAARNLYAYLRELDRKDIECIYVEMPGKEGLERALYDRLLRAVSTYNEI
jgi:L-threonylcarbamoyladenylate synthase